MSIVAKCGSTADHGAHWIEPAKGGWCAGNRGVVVAQVDESKKLPVRVAFTVYVSEAEWRAAYGYEPAADIREQVKADARQSVTESFLSRGLTPDIR